jgi:hypothetical protein
MYFILYYPFINHVIKFIFFHIMVIKIILNNEIQYLFFKSILFLRGKNMFVYIIGKTLSFKFDFVFWTNS